MSRISKAIAPCVLTAFFATAAQANGCFGAGQPLFHCTLKGGTKSVDICMQADVLLYRYGAVKGTAELLLAQRVENTYMRPWNGVGSSIYEEAVFSNGDVDYTVHYAIRRIAADDPDVSGGITVTRADQTLVDLSCDKGSIDTNDFYPIYEGKNALGQCWDTNTFIWGGC